MPKICKEVSMDFIAMRRNGYSIRKIARLAGIHRKTVKRYLESNSFPFYKKTKEKSLFWKPTPRLSETTRSRMIIRRPGSTSAYHGKGFSCFPGLIPFLTILFILVSCLWILVFQLPLLPGRVNGFRRF